MYQTRCEQGQAERGRDAQVVAAGGPGLGIRGQWMLRQDRSVSLKGDGIETPNS
jgi:hypothetical protein